MSKSDIIVVSRAIVISAIAELATLLRKLSKVDDLEVVRQKLRQINNALEKLIEDIQA